MKTPINLKLLALVALALCSGCASKPTTTTFVTPTSLQATISPQWDEAIAAQGAAKVNNNSLIIMR
jgi:hypothetical protein